MRTGLNIGVLLRKDDPFERKTSWLSVSKYAKFHFILVLLFQAIVAAQAEFLDWNVASNTLEPDGFDAKSSFDTFLPFDTSDLDTTNLGLLFDDERNPALFSSLPDNTCLSSPGAGKAQRHRRRHNEACFSEEEIPDPSRSFAEMLAAPGDYDEVTCPSGDDLASDIFLVCSSGVEGETRPVSFTAYVLYQSTRGRQIDLFPLSEVANVARQRCSLNYASIWFCFSVLMSSA